MKVLLMLLLSATPAVAQDGGDYLRALREQAEAQGQSEEVQVRASIHPGAIRVGDTLVYRLQFVVAPDMELHLEDLDAAFLEGAGWEIVDTRVERSAAASEGTLYRVEYDLRSFAIGPLFLEIPALDVRYYRAGAPVGVDLESGRVTVDAIRVPLRSTLPVEALVQSIRPLELPTPSPAGALGHWLGITFVLAGLSLGGVVFAGRFRKVDETVEEIPIITAGSWNQLESLPVDAVSQRREAYTRMDQLVRGTLAHSLAGDVSAQTVVELARHLDDGQKEWAELLRQCERGKYGPEGLVPAADQWRADLGRARHLARRSAP